MNEKFAIAVQAPQNASDFVISHFCFVGHGKEMYKDSKRTCRTTVLLIKTLVWWRSRCRCRRRRRRGLQKKCDRDAFTIVTSPYVWAKKWIDAWCSYDEEKALVNLNFHLVWNTRLNGPHSGNSNHMPHASQSWKVIMALECNRLGLGTASKCW